MAKIMDEKKIRRRLNQIILEHKDLDDAINLMMEKPFTDELQIKRLKTKKLKLKEEIILLESKLIPDIEA